MPFPVHNEFLTVHHVIPVGWSKKFYSIQLSGYFYSLIGSMTDLMINKRKILIVLGIAVAIVIGVYTGLFGMGMGI